jgi:hypothetical protein
MVTSIKIIAQSVRKSKNLKFPTPAPAGARRPSCGILPAAAAIFPSIFKCFHALSLIDQCQ